MSTPESFSQRLVRRVSVSLRPPYRLRTSILVATTLAITMLAILYATMASDRLSRKTLEDTQRWSEAVAQLTASSAAKAILAEDAAALASTLQQMALLPGIVDLAVFHPDGLAMAEIAKTNGVLSPVSKSTTRVELPKPGTKQLPSKKMGDLFESWARVNTETPSAQAWVRVHYAVDNQPQEVDRLWVQSLALTFTLLALVIASLHFILNNALRPIRNLAHFAQSMPQNMGRQCDVETTCIEADELGQALNQASRGVAEQVARVQAILNTASEAIIGLDAFGTVVTANLAASGMFGWPQAKLQGQPLEQCVPGVTHAALRAMFGDGFGDCGPRRLVRQDLFGARADGTPFPVEISVSAIADIPDLSFTCIIRDLTDERAAQETSELYERALACSLNGVFITNAKLALQPIVYVNEALQKITALATHEMLGGSMDVLCCADPYSGGASALFHAVQEQRSTTATLYRPRADGSQQVVEVSLSPVMSSSGVLTNFVGIVTDVSARVLAEIAVAERRKQLDAIFSLSPDGFVLFDSQDRLVFANPAFERITGLSWPVNEPPIVLDTFQTLLNGLCDTDKPMLAIHSETEGQQPWQAILHLTRPHTRVVKAQARRNSAGHSETILYFHDITHEDAVDRMKSEFLAAAAHELRTPMVSILGFTELLLHRQFSEERRTDMLQTIHRQSGLLVRMINELLDLARIESRRGLDLHIQAHPLQEMVKNSVKGLMRQDTERQVSVGMVPNVNVLVDPEKMQLALGNLLSNAFKYSPQGGAITVQARVDRRGEAPYAVIDIVDQGMGMSAAQLARAFERFYRADASGSIPGTGLGLSMVKEVVELHQGKVLLSSIQGEGTTATLWIPLATDWLDPTPLA